MNKKKRIILLIGITALVILALLAGYLIKRSRHSEIDERVDLVKNGGFETLTNAGQPSGWTIERWYTDLGVSILEADDTQAYEGQYSLRVENVEENDARWAQTLSVEPSSWYRITCMVKAEGCPEDRIGANLSIDNTFVHSESVYDTAGEWVQIELVGKTGKKQTSMTVFARLGGYGSLNTGKAWFDCLEVHPLAAAPSGVSTSFATLEPAKAESDIDKQASGDRTTLIVLVALAYLCVATFLALRADAQLTARPIQWLLPAALGAALAVRLILAVAVRGYPNDMTDFMAWADRIFARGPWGMYADNYFCDYPPGYMMLLWPIGALRALLGIHGENGLAWLSVKLIPIACDLLGACLVWRMGRKKLGARVAGLIAVVYLFNPAAILNSAMWGQVDSVLTLLLVIAIGQVMEGNWTRGMLCFAGAILVKPQALLFAPVGVMAMACEVFASRDRLSTTRDLLMSMVCAMLAVLAFSLCFSVGAVGGSLSFGKILTLAAVFVFVCLPLVMTMRLRAMGSDNWKMWQCLACVSAMLLIVGAALIFGRRDPVTWLIDLYGRTFSGYRYITINAANLYCALGMNWRALELSGGWYAFSVFMYVFAFAFAAILCFSSREHRQRLMLICAATMTILFAFGTKMHERYVFPVLLMLLFAYLEDRDVRILLAFLTVSFSLFVNTALVLQDEHLIASHRMLNLIISNITVLNALLMIWTGWDVCRHGHVITLNQMLPSSRAEKASAAPVKAKNTMRPVLLREDAHLHLRRVDYLIMIGITLVYSVLAFTNLGDLSAPQTSWVSTHADEEVVFDLGETRTFHMTYYGGICNSTFYVSTSDDGEAWSEEQLAIYKQGEIFKWLWYTPVTQEEDGSFTHLQYGYPWLTARYVRLRTQKAGLVLSEVGFLDEEGSPYPVLAYAHAGGSEDNAQDPIALIDEQDTVPAYPTYMNSMYFDEIYHGRTGYEFLHNLTPYETSHPPLGKVLIMLGIRLFGMTPFGWRCMGALVGVLMLPVMYLLIMQLFKKTEYATVGTFLMAVDAMHFTQTRIATIDSYGVFFIMLMYLFMLRYAQMSFYFDDFKKTLIPLGLSGLAMGLGIASKWICIYAGAGLAVLFFYTMYRRYREYRDAMNSGGKNRTDLFVRKNFVRYFWITIAFCVVFFIVVPCLIYYFSYYWYMKPLGGLSVSGVWKRQLTMFNYHKGVQDAHSFSSKWYEWPLIVKPMWYYSGTSFQPDGVISSISCMGNPAVWWAGLAALIFVIVQLVRGKGDRTSLYLVLGFAAQYLPWVLVPRTTFIYHYFASVPFIILCILVFMRWIKERHLRWSKPVLAVYLAIALVLFAAFYPLESGMPVARSYAQLLRWFNWINF